MKIPQDLEHKQRVPNVNDDLPEWFKENKINPAHKKIMSDRLSLKTIHLLLGGGGLLIGGIFISMVFMRPASLNAIHTDVIQRTEAEVSNETSLIDFEDSEDNAKVQATGETITLAAINPTVVKELYIETGRDEQQVGSIQNNVNAAKDNITSILASISSQAVLVEKKNKELRQLVIKQQEKMRTQAITIEMELAQKYKANENAFKQTLREKDTVLNEKNNALVASLKTVENLSKQVTRKDNEISALNSTLASFEATKNELISENIKLNEENDNLRRENGQLNIKVADLHANARSQKLTLSEPELEIKGPVKPAINETRREAAKPVKVFHKSTKRVEVKQSGLEGVKVIGATKQAIVAMKDGELVTIPVGKKWHGVMFNSVDTEKGVIDTSEGRIKVSQ